MLVNHPIRVKLLIGLGLLLLLVFILSGSGLYTTYSYRRLVKNLSWRAVELPLAAKLSRQVGDLRITAGQLQVLQANEFPHVDGDIRRTRILGVRDQFRAGLDEVRQTLGAYRRQLQGKTLAASAITDTRREWETVGKIDRALKRVSRVDRDEDWILASVKVGTLDTELERLQLLSAELPGHLHQRLFGFAREVRSQYRTLIVGMWAASVSAMLIFVLFVRLFWQWIFLPLRILIDGSRRVASGSFHHRIHLDANDEMAELAEAMNAMTTRFEAIRDDLDRQVRQRTQQAVRSEQLAGVGLLAAGVAHEINNPLASVALSAESLEDRLGEVLASDDERFAVIRTYLEMIQSEAFRCKEITGQLLDFSRTGQAKRQNTELGSLVQSVIEMVRHVGQYQKKLITFTCSSPVVASVNPQEIRQITLNLLTNALESLDEGGTVRVHLARCDGFADLTFDDDGCGMEAHVVGRVFEPFFTRRPSGQGTGLGLSITHQIVTDHGGQIHAESPGPKHGSTFRVRLPLVDQHKERDHRYREMQSPEASVC